MNKQYKNAVNKLKVSDSFKNSTVEAMIKAKSQKQPFFNFRRSAIIAASAAAALAVISFAAWGGLNQQDGLTVGGTKPPIEDIVLGGNGDAPGNAPAGSESFSAVETPSTPGSETSEPTISSHPNIPVTTAVESHPPVETAPGTEIVFPAFPPQSDKILTNSNVVNNPFPYKANDSFTYDQWFDIQWDYDVDRRNDRESREFEEALKNFSYSSAAAVLKDPGQRNKDGNVCFSPISYYYALSMLTCGADGETQDELMNALMMEGMTVDEMAENSRKVYLRMNHEFPGNIGKLSNSLWLNSELTPGFKESFAKQMQDKYYASIFYREFDDEGTKLLQDWVNDTTNNFLHYNGKLYSFQDMRVINTIYCKVAWYTPFLAEYNKVLPFHLSDGTVKEVEFMNQLDKGTHNYIRGKDYQGYFKDTSSGRMIFILPNEGVSVESIAGNPEKLKEISAPYYENPDMRPYANVDLTLPKFDIKTDMGLTNDLVSRGVKKAFSPIEADFSKISDAALSISDIMQGSRIKVDEKGAEAAAITDITLGSGSYTPPPAIDVKLTFDRPFIFILEHDGYPAFMGIIEYPTNE